MKKTKSTTRLALYVNETRDSGYYKIIATVVTIGANQWERHCRDDGSYAYPEIHDDTIRNANDDDYNGLFLNNFAVDCLGSDNDTPRHLFGWDYLYKTPHAVKLRDATRMAKTLQTITRRLDKIYQQYGNAATFGAYLARVAQAIGADRIIRPDGKQYGWSYSENAHRILTIADGIYSVDHSIRQWETERERQAAERAQQETARATA